MLVLTDVQRVAILSGCVAMVAVALVITLCLVCPFCYINKRLMKRHRKPEQVRMACFQNGIPLLDPPPPYEPTNRISVHSYGSDSESVTGIPLPIMSDAEIATLDISESQTSDPGTVSITVQYKRITSQDQRVFPQLRIDLKEAVDLPLRAYGGRCNPYFVIKLYDLKSFKQRKKRCSVPKHEFLSTVVQKCQNPVFNESFFIPLQPIALKGSVLQLEAWDRDSLVNDTALGESAVRLKDVLNQESSKEIDLQLKLENMKVNNGQVLLGLCYLPTAERMTVAVLKASGLKIQETAEGFYVQAMAIYSGKIFERRKTSRRPLSPQPVFNEMLMFDVPTSKLDQVTLLLGVFATGCLGKVVIGAKIGHWNAMKHSPRRQVIQWHQLR